VRVVAAGSKVNELVAGLVRFDLNTSNSFRGDIVYPRADYTHHKAQDSVEKREKDRRRNPKNYRRRPPCRVSAILREEKNYQEKQASNKAKNCIRQSKYLS
jgi:hypothetical protein